MRNRGLHDALRLFALEAASLLRDDQSSGAEIEFDLDGGSRGSGPALYHYRPLTSKFIGERWTRLRMLESRKPAADALGVGASAYLRVNGVRGGEADPALRAMLERLYEDMTDFTFPEERFGRVYAEVERTLYEQSVQATVLVPVHGLTLQAERVDLGDGMELARGDRTDAPDEAVWGDPADPSAGDERREPNALLMLTKDMAPDAGLPLDEARERFRTLLTGLRLWKAGGVSLAAVAWRRTGDGRWQPFELEPTGVARGEPWILVEGEEAELADFLDAVRTPAAAGPVAWSMARFDMGCGRRQESEALSDYLLAMRALIDEGRTGLALRVAVLCAEEHERKSVQRRIELAQALERFVIGDGPDDTQGGTGGDYMDAVGADSPRTLVDEVERHLRALLRDILCGYLDPDLRKVADDLLLDQPEPFEIRAHRVGPSSVVSRQSSGQAPPPEPELEPEPEPEGVVQAACAGEGSDPVLAGQPEFDWDDPEGYSPV